MGAPRSRASVLECGNGVCGVTAFGPREHLDRLWTQIFGLNNVAMGTKRAVLMINCT